MDDQELAMDFWLVIIHFKAHLALQCYTHTPLGKWDFGNSSLLMDEWGAAALTTDHGHPERAFFDSGLIKFVRKS